MFEGAGSQLRLAARVSSREIGRRVFGALGDDRVAFPAPSPSLAMRRYREIARDYDVWTAAGQAFRDRAVEKLAPVPGSVVLDVGCGTGLNFVGIQAAIGPRGRLIGIDLSSDMLVRARERVERHGWQNMTLIEAAGEDVAVPRRADAVLLSAVHDILRSPAALANILGHVRPGGRVVAAGPKWVSWWRPASFALNSCGWLLNRSFVTTFEGFDAPWTHLARLLPDLAVEEVFFGAGFIAVGTRRAVPDPPLRRRVRQRQVTSAGIRGRRPEPTRRPELQEHRSSF